MEVQPRKPGPWFVFQHGKHQQSQTFYNMAIGGYHERSIRQMRKKVWLSSYGWLLLEDSFGRFSLFDPLSLKEFEVPKIPIRHRDCICVLSAPPTDPDCQLILMKKKKTSIPIKKLKKEIKNNALVFYFCRITQDRDFTEAKFNVLEKSDGFIDAVSCKGGKTYFLTFYSAFGVINVDPGNHFPTPKLLVLKRPMYGPYHHTVKFLVESCGEIFLVYIIIHRTRNRVINLIVFKMDFSHMRWENVKSIGDLLFILGRNCSQSCPAFESGLEGDQIFFFLPNDIGLYSFHMKERCISVNLTCPNVQPPWKSPFWILLTSTEAKTNMEKMGQSNVNIELDMKSRQLINTSEKIDGVKMTEEIAVEKISIDKRPWSDLSIEIVRLITTRLTPIGYARMRSICKSWRSITPPAWLPLTPCLMFHDGIDGLCKFFDPLSKRVYAANIPELHGATFHFSKGDWLIVSLDDDSIFLFNPFSKERINLPDLDYPFITVSFSSMPNSPDCIVVAVFNVKGAAHILIYTYSPGAQCWDQHLLEIVYPQFCISSPSAVCHNGLFYYLGEQGNLGVYNVSENTVKVLKIPVPFQLPVGHYFLIKSKGELLFVYYRQSQIHIFTLDQSKMIWLEIERMEDVTLFLSQPTSLAMVVGKEATTTIRDMKNKIYFSSFRQESNDALCYSMESKSHHLDIYGSKEFINCTWIEPTGFEFGLDSQGNILSITSRFR